MTFLIPFLFFVISLETVYYIEEFEDLETNKWKSSKMILQEQGEFELSSGKWYGDKRINQGLKTKDDPYKRYYLSSKITPFQTKGNDLIFQFSFKMENPVICGGGYLKLYSPGFDQENYGNETHFLLMFGPDICGNVSRIFIIFDYEGESYVWQKIKDPPKDKLSHLYGLFLFSNNTYKVQVDMNDIEGGNIFDDFGIPEIYSDECISGNENKCKLNSSKINSNDNNILRNQETEFMTQQFLQYEIGGIGIEVIQLKGGSIWDSIILTNFSLEALDLAESAWQATYDEERLMYIRMNPDEVPNEENIENEIQKDKSEFPTSNKITNNLTFNSNSNSKSKDDKKKKQHDEL